MSELIESAGCALERVARKLIVGQPVQRLDAPVGGAQDGVLADAPPAGDEVDPARQVARPKARETLEAALSSTPATEAGILRLRYGLAGCELATYEEVERMLGISLEGARQTAARALSALRERLQVTARCP